MMYCQYCGLFFLDDATTCPECGEPLVQTIKELPLEDSDQNLRDLAPIREISPKPRNTVILLCYFLGIFGVHRFYLGKILTGIFMLLTLGGLTIWTCVDFVIAITGTYSDSKGRLIEKDYNHTMVTILIVAPVLLLILSTIILFILAYSWFKEGVFLEA